VLTDLPRDVRIGVGVVDQKQERVETPTEIAARARRVLRTPDCGFATFADTPIAPAGVAEAKLHAIVEAARLVRRG